MASPTVLISLLVLLLAVVVARRLQGLLGSAALPAILLELTVGFLLGNTVLPFERLSGVTVGMRVKLESLLTAAAWQLPGLVIMVTTTSVLGLFLLNQRVQSLRRKASP